MPLSCTVHYFQKYLWSSHAVLALLDMGIKKKPCSRTLYLLGATNKRNGMNLCEGT